MPGIGVVMKTVGRVDLLASGEYCEKRKANRMDATLQFCPNPESGRIGYSPVNDGRWCAPKISDGQLVLYLLLHSEFHIHEIGPWTVRRLCLSLHSQKAWCGGFLHATCL